LALFLGETTSMLEYEMFPYLFCPLPPDTTEETLGCDLMVFVQNVPFNFLESSIAFIATIVRAGPLWGVRYAVLGTLRNFNV
jgi:hypothetical protein